MQKNEIIKGIMNLNSDELDKAINSKRKINSELKGSILQEK